MAHSEASDRLGPLDTLFLYIEKKEMPLHIGSVFIFDGPISTGELKSLIEAKLPLIPRYRQRLAFPPLNLGYPTWEWDPNFDIDRHIFHARIKPGTKESLETLAGQLFSQIMDRNRPLWDMTVVDGLRGGRSALIARIHHCLVDGIAGVALVNLILDSSSRPASLPPKKPFHLPPSPVTGTSLVDAFITSYFHTMNRVLSMQSAALDVAGELLRDVLQGSLVQPVAAVPETFRPLEPFPFKAPSLGPRRVCWTEFPLAEADAIHKRCGVKVNDVLLTVLGAAMRRCAQLHRLSVKNRVLRLMVPVNLRSPDQNGVGNRISLVPVNIPLDVKDPVELLSIVHKRTEALKHAHAADLIVLGGTLLAMLPIPVQAVLTGMLSNAVPVLPFDMVCTNVPGPQVPLYLLGRKMLTYYPYVPIGDFMGVCCAMASYNGTLYFSLTGDCACAPDLERLRDFLDEALSELRERSGVAPKHRVRLRSKPVVAVASAEAPLPVPVEAPADMNVIAK
ncbi:MAG TPA: wax ester/triacylglycerol synthase family O-acyltransferase [Bryobacteraceae bacterium]|nr:wax ester/triacylglycerol synthase family O-acyltransferase [Bryobacteraceae bacterium]